jgi:DNA-binding helix-hairpin-helix protein with protein kinase domain
MVETFLEVLLDGKRVRLGGDPVATGGQASVYAVVGRPEILVKVYHEPPDDDQRRRLAAMVRMSPLAGRSTATAQAPELAWPIAQATDAKGVVIGYSMGRFGLPEHVALGALFERQLRARFFTARLDWRFLLGVAWNLAYMTARLHDEGIIVGDFSARNIVVSQGGFVTFLDCDSMAFTDPVSGEVFHSHMHTPEYTAPERYGGAHASAATDDFSLAVLVYQLLTAGNHPFGGVPRESDSSVSMRSRISGGSSYVLHPEKIVVPRGTVLPSTLPPAVLELARRTFETAVTEPARRPTSIEWLTALEAERPDVRVCGRFPFHSYASHRQVCPWCERTERGEPELFTTPEPLSPLAPPPTVPPPVPLPPLPAPARSGNAGTATVVVAVLVLLLIVLIVV